MSTETVIGILLGFILGNTIVLLYLCHKRLPMEINRMKGGLIQRPPNIQGLEIRVEALARELREHYLDSREDLGIGTFIKVYGKDYCIKQIHAEQEQGKLSTITIEGDRHEHSR